MCVGSAPVRRILRRFGFSPVVPSSSLVFSDFLALYGAFVCRFLIFLHLSRSPDSLFWIFGVAGCVHPPVLAFLRFSVRLLHCLGFFGVVRCFSPLFEGKPKRFNRTGCSAPSPAAP